MRARIAAADSITMFLEPPFDVGRDAGIKALIFTAEDINVVHGSCKKHPSPGTPSVNASVGIFELLSLFFELAQFLFRTAQLLHSEPVADPFPMFGLLGRGHRKAESKE